MRALVFGLVVLSIGCASSTPSSGVSPIAPSAAAAPTSTRLVSGSATLAPDPVLVEQFSGQLDRAMRKAFRVPGNGLEIRSLATLITVPINTRAANTYTFPNPSGNQVAVPEGNRLATFTLNVSAADKATVGKTLQWSIWFSTDGVTFSPSAEAGWASRGIATDPDSQLQVSLRQGAFIRGVIVLPQPLELGVTIDVQ